MPLSRLAGVSNFCFNSLSLFLLIVRILFSQAMSIQILLYQSSHGFPWLILFPFPSYFNFHNLTCLGIDVSTHDMTIPPQTALNYHILNLHNNTHLSVSLTLPNDNLSVSLTLHIILIRRRSTSRNLASSATVSSHDSQQYNKTGLIQHW